MAGSSSRLDEGKVAEPLDLVAHAQSVIEIYQVRAAAQQDMLTVVHNFASARMLIRRCPATHVGTALVERDLEAGIGERATGSKPGQSSADDGCCFHAMRCKNPRESTFSFSNSVRCTRSVNTS